MSRDPALRQVLNLVGHGIPWGVAVELSPVERLGYVVAIGEIAGGSFDWPAMEWREPK